MVSYVVQVHSTLIASNISMKTRCHMLREVSIMYHHVAECGPHWQFVQHAVIPQLSSSDPFQSTVLLLLPSCTL